MKSSTNVVSVTSDNTELFTESKLIEGKFSPLEARQEILKLITGNINYHSKRSFSHHERYGSPDIQAEEQIKALAECREKALELVAQAQKQGLSIQVETDIKITLTNE